MSWVSLEGRLRAQEGTGCELAMWQQLGEGRATPTDGQTSMWLESPSRFCFCDYLHVSWEQEDGRYLLEVCHPGAPHPPKNVSSHPRLLQRYQEGVTQSAGNSTGEHMDLRTAADLKLNLLPLSKLRGQTCCKPPDPHSQGPRKNPLHLQTENKRP